MQHGGDRQQRDGLLPRVHSNLNDALTCPCPRAPAAPACPTRGEPSLVTGPEKQEREREREGKQQAHLCVARRARLVRHAPQPLDRRVLCPPPASAASAPGDAGSRRGLCRRRPVDERAAACRPGGDALAPCSGCGRGGEGRGRGRRKEFGEAGLERGELRGEEVGGRGRWGRWVEFACAPRRVTKSATRFLDRALFMPRITAVRPARTRERTSGRQERTRRLEVPHQLCRLPRAGDLGLEEQLRGGEFALGLQLGLVRCELGLVRVEGGLVGVAERGVEVLLRRAGDASVSGPGEEGVQSSRTWCGRAR